MTDDEPDEDTPPADPADGEDGDGGGTDDDPFEQLPDPGDPGSDRDPFEELSGENGDGDGDDPFEELSEGDTGGEERSGGDDPLGGLPEDDDGGDPFEELLGEGGSSGGDPGTAWDELRERSGDERQEAVEGAGVEEVEPPDPEDGSDTEVHTVPKRSFCEGCRFLSTPPEFACTHDGTEIIEFPDRDHVRVRNCPIVRERRALDDLGGGPGEILD